MNEFNPVLLEKIIADQAIRSNVTRQSILWFFHVYLPHYVLYPTAPFHHEMFSLIEDETVRTVAVVAFRGSAKSTIMTLAYPLWAILGKQQKKFILIVGQTQQQARQHLKNIKEELEHNVVLRQDLGPFKEEDEWSSYTLVVPKYEARITAVSMEQGIRGIRHAEHRPDLIVCDDIEDLSSVKTREGRDKTHQWLMGEVLPTGAKDTRTVIIGNLLHEDSLIMRVRKAMRDKSLDGVFRSYPLLAEDGRCLWPGKYPTEADVESERRRIGNEAAWHREYLLHILSDHERLVHPEWIEYYDELPVETSDFRLVQVCTGVDLAISQKESADYTAMVSAKMYGSGENMRIYILPHPVNKKLTFPQTVEKLKDISWALGNGQHPTKLIIEDVAYQKGLIQELAHRGLPAEGFSVQGQDKRARLAPLTTYIQQKKILFPRKGAEPLISQLTGFGVERHDDLADAFGFAALKLLADQQSSTTQIIMVGSYREAAWEGFQRRWNNHRF